jgi:hypothetical protein
LAMGSVVQFSRRRSIEPRQTKSSTQHDADERRALVVLAVVFAATAVAMGIAVVVAGSSTWAEAIPLILFVVVFALTKIVLADALFYVMIRSDAQAEARTLTSANTRAAGLVIRRAPHGRHLRPVVGHGTRARQAAPTAIKLAPVPRKPKGRPPSKDTR